MNTLIYENPIVFAETKQTVYKKVHKYDEKSQYQVQQTGERKCVMSDRNHRMHVYLLLHPLYYHVQ